MEKTEQLLKILGFANRAGKLRLGMSSNLQALAKGRACAIIFAEDSSENAQSKIKSAASAKRVPIYRFGNKARFGELFGRNEVAIIGIVDSGFAKAIFEILNGRETELQRKQAIRQRIEKQRRNLPKEWIAARSAEIIARLKSLPEFQTARTVHAYIAWRSEVDNHSLIKEMLQEDRRVVVPVVDLTTRTLRHSQIEQFEDLAPRTFGILEPPPERFQPAALGEIDLIIVPGIAFDLNGNRIGFGGGYYDDFLRQTCVLKIGLCFHFQIIDQIPTRAQDERVDMLITEKGVYDFRRKT